jgi:hypothetical protein
MTVKVIVAVRAEFIGVDGAARSPRARRSTVWFLGARIDVDRVLARIDVAGHPRCHGEMPERRCAG